MPLKSKYPRSTTRDMEVSEVQGSATRFFGDNSNYPSGGTGQKARGDNNILRFPKNPQPKPVGKLKTSIKP